MRIKFYFIIALINFSFLLALLLYMPLGFIENLRTALYLNFSKGFFFLVILYLIIVFFEDRRRFKVFKKEWKRNLYGYKR